MVAKQIVLVRLDICTIPLEFLEKSYGGAGGCFEGMALGDGASCDVQCAAGFEATPAGNPTYTCAADGHVLTPATLVCTGPRGESC